MGRSTLPEDVPRERLRRAQHGRRAFLVVVFVFVALGLLGVFGVKTATVRASGGGYDLEVRYARVARSGLAVPWSVTIRHPGGFEGPVTLASNSAYFDLFDANSLEPDPESSTTDGERFIWELSPPEEGDTMVVSLDTRVGPNAQLGTSGSTAVLVDGEPVVQVRYKTWVMP